MGEPEFSYCFLTVTLRKLTDDSMSFLFTCRHRFKQIGLVVSSPVSRIIQDVPASTTKTTARSATKSKEKTKRKKRVASDASAMAWGDVIAYSLVAGSIVGFVGIVWGSFRQ